ncbi:hypothetical protein K1719_043010 [Acacia pycnantha]|nr:hypothetical protein K1719_043010 [Acacia pycnantha]
MVIASSFICNLFGGEVVYHLEIAGDIFHRLYSLSYCTISDNPIAANISLTKGLKIALALFFISLSLASICLYKHQSHDLEGRAFFFYPKPKTLNLRRWYSGAFDLMKNEKVHAIIGPLFSKQARIAQGDRSKVKAIAAIVDAYGWHEIILIYEDTEYGRSLIPYLVDKLENVSTRVPNRSAINPNSEESEILEELKKQNQRYGWIVTYGLSNGLDPNLGPKLMDSMQGVLGIRPKVEKSRRLTSFRNRWKASSIKQGIVSSPLTLFGLWAYDTVWAIAMAVESTFPNSKELEVFNVVGRKERVIGSWSPQRGLFHDKEYSLSRRKKLMPPIWPGDITNQPTKLRIGVPVYDAVVGDVTIVANRSEHVDFTLPYSESGVLMVVSMKHDERQNMWIFLKPLSLGLWLTTGAAFVLTGIIIWLHERRTNTEFQGSPQQQLGMMFWFSFSGHLGLCSQGKISEQLVAFCADPMGICGSHHNTKLYCKFSFHVNSTEIAAQVHECERDKKE